MAADGRGRPGCWVLATLAPFALYFGLRPLGLDDAQAQFIATAGLMVLLWMCALVPDFIPALLGLLILALFGVAPESVILSGFASPGFVLALSVMGLGAVVSTSGLTRRYARFLLRHLPPNTFAHQAALFFTGLLFIPVVPTITGRAVIVAPILNDLAARWDPATRARAQTALYASGLHGFNFLSPLFLTGAPANFMIYGLLPAQEQDAFQFVFWAFAASVVGLVLLAAWFLVAALWFRAFARVEQAPETEFEASPLSSREWLALAGILALALGIATSQWHKIDIEMVAFAVLLVLLLCGALSREDFVKRIDWAFLFLLGSMIGLLTTLGHLRLDQALMARLGWLGHYMRSDFPLFVAILAGAMLVVRQFIPLNSAILIFAAALIPVADQAGVSTWLVGFLILLLAETALFPYQSPYILYFRNITRRSVQPDERRLTLFQAILFGAKLLAVYASIPFWKHIGVL